MKKTHECFSYVGKELGLFQNARNWKKYLGNLIRPYLSGRILEVGAGIGANTIHLCDETYFEWICLEPDAELATSISRLISARKLPSTCSVLEGTILTLPRQSRFDSIIYLDVLEHILDDMAELTSAAGRLAPDGHLIVVVPAHQWLFTAFDKAIGHYRRYTLPSLLKLAPSSVTTVASFYLDSIGLLASIGNRLFLKSAMPSRRQIALWDRLMVPLSTIVDPLTRYRLGKSIMVVWKKRR